MASMLCIGCTSSNNQQNTSQIASAPEQYENTQSAEDQDAQWISFMQNQSVVLQNDLDAISKTQTSNAEDPFDADNLSKAGQKLVDDTKIAMEENDNYTVSNTLKDAKEYWRLALQNYNSAGQFTVIGANEYKNSDKDSATTNLEKAGKFINSANGDVLLASKSLQTKV
jgi:hypothetical protein